MLKDKCKTLPTTSGVYIMKDSVGNIIYIGKAKNLKNRVSQYFNNTQKHSKVANMVSHISDFEYILTPSELDAFMLESNLVKKYMPYYNILLKDDKAFAYIKIDLSKDYPYIEVTRKVKKDKAKYFGPYFNGINAKDLVKLIQYVYPIRSCKNLKVKRECLNYHLGLCSAPCTNKITKNEYDKLIKNVIDFLKGKVNVSSILESKMQGCIASENYEQAIVYRDLLNIVSKLKERAIDRLPTTANLDVWGYYNGVVNYLVLLVIRAGKMIGYKKFSLNEHEVDGSMILQYYENNVAEEILLPYEIEDSVLIQKALNNKYIVNIPQKGLKRKLVLQANANAKELSEKDKSIQKQDNTMQGLEQLKQRLNLSSIPYRIEGYDISHISGTDKVASMVVAINGEKAPKMYRKFKIKTVEGVDDFACLYEAINRRLQRLNDKDVSFSDKPNLILIDGGKGQLSTCYELINKYGIDVISLAKREEEVFVPNNPISVIFKRSDKALKILQNLRDEAHRFAITFHRSLRGKRQTKSQLDNIKGIGEKKKKALIDKFKSVNNIKQATIDDLMLVKGIDINLAKSILNELNK